MGRDNQDAAAPEVTEDAPTGEANSGVEKFTTSEGQADDARKIDIEFDFGGSSARAVELFGEDAVYNGFVRGAKVALQGFVRAKLSDPELGDEEILVAVSEWKPGARATRATSKTSKLEKLLAGMDADEKAGLIAKLQAMQTESAE